MRENIRDQNGLVFTICQEKEEGDIFHQTQVPLIQKRACSNKYTVRVLIGSRTCCLGDVYTNSNSCNYNISCICRQLYLHAPTISSPPSHTILPFFFFFSRLSSGCPPSTPPSLPLPPLTLQHVSVGVV